MVRPEAVVVIPALNEASTIAKVVLGIGAVGHVVVVDDCSSDDTSARAAAAGATVVRHEINQGYDKALESGFRRAADLGAEYVVTLDADGQHDPTLVLTFLNRLRGGDHLVIGMRRSPARLAERAFALYTGLRYRVRDPLCGLKAYRLDLYRELGHFDSYGSVGTELMLYGLRTGRPYSTIPVPIAARAGVPRFASRFRANMKILRALRRSI